jgi:Tol biopolymer transport system component
MAIGPGARIGPYQVVAWLGSGGMGDVYRARDPRLARDVAIKVMPQGLAASADRVRRFEQEARAAGRLNHPNVLAIYDVGLDEGSLYLVSELLEGETVRARVQRGRLSPRKATGYARQIAEGLAVAHDAGIIHRDVKPENLFVTADERVKLLDFGIAKLRRPDDRASSGHARTETDAGLVVGSAAYMSPEQVRGEVVDARSDLFSLGAVLYEMLAGRSAFARDTAAETMTAILNEDPPPFDAPRALERLVFRCLEKTRKARCQSARDLAFALDLIAEPTTAEAPAPVVSAGWRRPSSVGAGIVALLVAVAAAGLVRSCGSTEPSASVSTIDTPAVDRLVRATITQLTDWQGTEALAEISPDGRFVAFLSDRDGHFDIWMNQVGTPDFRNLTTTLPPMNPPGTVLRAFGFTADGGGIWFSTSGNPGDRKMVMPLLGGTPRPFLGDGDITPSWSPDGERVAFVNNRNGDPLFVADATGADAVRILAPEEGVLHNHDPVWSPDGLWIYFTRGREPAEEMDVWRVSPRGGAPERLTNLHTEIRFLAPLDVRTLLFVAREADRSGPWLWALDTESRITRRVSWGLEHYTSVAASRDGRRVIATAAHPTSTLWIAPILDRLAEDHDVVPHPVATAHATAPRFSGTSVFVLSTGNKGGGLWRFTEGHATEVWRGAEGALSEPPAISADGRRMAMVLSRHGRRQLSVSAIDGTNARTLARSIDLRGAAGQSTVDWSSDGTWLVAGGADAEGPGLFRIPADDGEPVRLVRGQATNPVCSPDGTLIVYAGAFVAGQAPLMAIRTDGTPVDLASVTVRQGGYRFLPDGRGLVFLPGLQSRDFWLLDLSTGRQRPLTRLSDLGRLETFDVSPDGKHIVFNRARENSDIALIDVPK